MAGGMSESSPFLLVVRSGSSSSVTFTSITGRFASCQCWGFILTHFGVFEIEKPAGQVKLSPNQCHRLIKILTLTVYDVYKGGSVDS
jgi:hypothetical protein